MTDAIPAPSNQVETLSVRQPDALHSHYIDVMQLPWLRALTFHEVDFREFGQAG